MRYCKKVKNAKKAIFLIDAMLSVLFMIFIIAYLLIIYNLYKIYEYDNALTANVNKALFISYYDIATDKKREFDSSNLNCIIRYTTKKEVFCYENS
jgi:hypothetical protein